MSLLTDREIESCYAEGLGMVVFARKIEAAVAFRMETDRGCWHDNATCPTCKGPMSNPCDSGCCNAYFCAECDVVYYLAVNAGPGAEHYRQLACNDCFNSIVDDEPALCPKHLAAYKARPSWLQRLGRAFIGKSR